MLHCPRCSGPLDVREQQQPQHQPRTSTCPAGNLCPHQTTSTSSASSTVPTTVGGATPWGFGQPPSKAVNYLSGGSIMLSTPQLAEAAFRQQQQQQQQLLQQRLSAPPNLTVCPPSSSSALDPLQLQAMQNLHLGGGAVVTTAGLTSSQESPPSAAASSQQHATCSNVPSSNICPHVVQQQQQFLQSPAPVMLNSGLLQQQQILGGAPIVTCSGNVVVPNHLSFSSTPFGLHPQHHHLHPQQPQTPAIVVCGNSPFFATVTQPQATLPSAPRPLSLPSNSSAPTSVMTPSSQHRPVPNLHEVLSNNKRQLEETGWFYPKLKWDESAELLAKSEPGTFLVRDSADPRFLFSLSVQRSKSDEGAAEEDGPTSVRIHFQGGMFRLDAEESIREAMPAFPSVVALMQHYLVSTPPAVKKTEEEETQQEEGRQSPKKVWVNNIGKVSSPICLRRPLYREVPSLSHFARLSVNKRLVETGAAAAPAKAAAAIEQLGLPKDLKTYLAEYPHRV